MKYYHEIETLDLKIYTFISKKVIVKQSIWL